MCSVIHWAHGLATFISIMGGLVLFFALLAAGSWFPQLLVSLFDAEERWTILSWFGVIVAVAGVCFLILAFSPSYLNNSCHIPTPSLAK